MWFAGPAQAGDLATLNILGFSGDGSTFAYEEYGVQDGSGFPYANRFYIDTTDDTYAASPIRVRLDDETATVDQARAEAKSQGQAVISDAELLANPGYAAGLNSITELSADPHRMTVNPRPVIPPIDAPVEVWLEEKMFDAEGYCEGVTDANAGFRLLAVEKRPGASVSLLHEDTAVPSSRACPLGYRLGGVQTFYPSSGTPVFAVMLAIESYGFEGPDFHWMAVTYRGAAAN